MSEVQYLEFFPEVVKKTIAGEIVEKEVLFVRVSAGMGCDAVREATDEDLASPRYKAWLESQAIKAEESARLAEFEAYKASKVDSMVAKSSEAPLEPSEKLLEYEGSEEPKGKSKKDNEKK